MVRSKFRVVSVTKSPEGATPGGSVKLQAVVSGSRENESFFNLTPYGNIEMGTVNPAALEQFEEGKEVYVDFTPAE